MFKPFFLFLLLLAALPAGAQQAAITNIAGAKKDAELNFPVISLPDRAVARKINDYLQINLLKQTTLKAPGLQVFDKAKWTEKQTGIDAMNYTVYANNGNLLSMGLDFEWMGAHPEPDQASFVFNSQNGEIILPADIFTQQGMKELAGEVTRKRSELIAAHLTKLKADPDAAEGIGNIKENYASCNTTAKLEAFYVTATGIVFHKANCLPHVIANLDIPLDITYSFDQLRSRLSAFGQKLLSPVKQDISKDSFPSLEKPLRGKIDNKYDIVMQLHFYGDHSVGGFYYYNNYQSAIEISGKLEGGVLELKEHDADYNDTAVFTGTIRGTAYSGVWTNLKTKKSLGFAVKN